MKDALRAIFMLCAFYAACAGLWYGIAALAR